MTDHITVYHGLLLVPVCMAGKEITERISIEDRHNWHLYVDAVYKAKTNADLRGDVLAKIFHGIHNLGGFRYPGKIGALPPFLILYSSGEHLEWRDDVLLNNGIFTYYGDNKTAEKEFTETSLKGNSILQQVFDLAYSDDVEARKKIPPIFAFKKETGRNVQFLGLAVPGVKGTPSNDWLIAEWRTNKIGKRYLNYRAVFNLLDTSKGSKAEPNKSGISLSWLTDIEKGMTYDSAYAPYDWTKYIRKEDYAILVPIQEKEVKSREEQLPSDSLKKQLLQTIYDYFHDFDNGYSFEPFANQIVKLLDSNVIDIITTRPYRDGGKDGIGRYKVFQSSLQNVEVEFYVQAKCYNPTGNHAVKVSDMSRLISRIKNRQFGVMVTTSYVHKQVYKELLDDEHPIVLVTGKTIVDILCDKYDIHSKTELLEWLRKNHPLESNIESE